VTRRPVVGVTSIPKEAMSGFGPNPHETVPEFYLRMLAQAGAAPIVLPVHAGWSDEVRSVLDAVVLTGGGDVDPTAYGQEPAPTVYGVDSSRDEVEFRLVRWAVDGGIPLLAVCRGVQAMNVALGGTLVQDIATEVPGALDHVRTDHHEGPVHAVRIESDSLLADLLGSDAAEVNSMHHQAVESAGENVRVVATAPDGVVEGIEVRGAGFALGVQWHPECLGREDPSFGIFEGLVRAAASRRT
jgi:putative glutamine amidotransferase